MKTAQEIRDALAWRPTEGEGFNAEMSALQDQARDEVVYARVLARLGRGPDLSWNEEDDPRLVAWRGVVENEVRVLAERLQDATGRSWSTKEAFDLAKVSQVTNELAAVVRRIEHASVTFAKAARHAPSLEDAQAIPLNVLNAKAAS